MRVCEASGMSDEKIIMRKMWRQRDKTRIGKDHMKNMWIISNKSGKAV